MTWVPWSLPHCDCTRGVVRFLPVGGLADEIAPVVRLGVAGLLLAASLTAVAARAASSVEVKLTLPVRARLDLANRTPSSRRRSSSCGRKVKGASRPRTSTCSRSSSYLLKILKRDTDLDIVESGPIDYPTYDLRMLARDAEFWRVIGERTQADHPGGQPRFRHPGSQRLPHRGIRLALRRPHLLPAGPGRADRLRVRHRGAGLRRPDRRAAYTDNFKDFKSFEGERADLLVGMFENLYALEDRLLGIFVQKRVAATRVLLTD